MFFRRVPDGGGYAVMAGLQQFIDAVDHLEFTDEDIDYLRSTKAFDEKFLTYLANFKLHCNIWAIEEGMPIFPQEPIVTVEVRPSSASCWKRCCSSPSTTSA